MQLMRAVELVILQRVNDVKADEPEHDRRRQQQRQDRAFAQWPECEAVLDREPPADGRQREGYTEKGKRIFFELGEGGVDFPAILEILKKKRWNGWLTVELDSSDTTPKESATRSKRYLEEVLKLTL